MTTRQIWAKNQAEGLLEDYKSRGIIGKKWTFAWNRCKTIYGYCSYTTKQIYLSKPYVEAATEEDILDTIKHEIAHIIAGPKAGHGPKWKRVCLRVGAMPKRTVDVIKSIPAKYTGVCPKCKAVFRAHRKWQNMNRRICQKAGCDAKKFNKYIVWETSNGAVR